MKLLQITCVGAGDVFSNGKVITYVLNLLLKIIFKYSIYYVK